MTSTCHLPKHIAIIMDGNARWAKRHNLSKKQGYQHGMNNVKSIIEAIVKYHIEYVTLYVFSSENRKRPQNEIDVLMSLISKYCIENVANIHANDIRLTRIGKRDGVNESALHMIDKAIKLTRNNSKITIQLAFNYGSREEILHATKEIVRQVQEGQLSMNEIDLTHFEQGLFTADCPDPDLIIRTGGEYRLSNFLLWQSAYAELYFTDILWPDFSVNTLNHALDDFQKRERRFGNVKQENL